MDELINTFHIDYKLLIAQVVNFTIVFFVLWFFALKPLMKIMQERTNTIEKSLKDSKKIEEKLHRTREDYDKKLQEAKEVANKILTEAQKDAGHYREEMIVKAKTEIEKLVRDAKSQINDEKVAMIRDAREKIVDLLVLALEKILGKEITNNIDHKIITESLEDIKKK